MRIEKEKAEKKKENEIFEEQKFSTKKMRANSKKLSSLGFTALKNNETILLQKISKTPELKITKNLN